MFTQFVRGKKNERVGVVVAEVMNDVLCVGWSRCNKRDKFSREKAIQIAEGRMRNVHRGDLVVQTPWDVVDTLEKVVNHFDEQQERGKVHFTQYAVRPVPEQCVVEEDEEEYVLELGR